MHQNPLKVEMTNWRSKPGNRRPAASERPPRVDHEQTAIGPAANFD
jgi:hypothetical protein